MTELFLLGTIGIGSYLLKNLTEENESFNSNSSNVINNDISKNKDKENNDNKFNEELTKYYDKQTLCAKKINSIDDISNLNTNWSAFDEN